MITATLSKGVVGMITASFVEGLVGMITAIPAEGLVGIVTAISPSPDDRTVSDKLLSVFGTTMVRLSSEP
jgi:hypothetical protein